MSTRERETALKLCCLALQGELSLEKLHAEWPLERETIQLYDEIYNDIADGVEHCPFKFLTNKIDEKRWRDSEMYTRIYIDCKLLQSGIADDQLPEIRRKIQENWMNVSKADIEQTIDAIG